MEIINEKSTQNIPHLYSQDGLNKASIVYMILEGINGWKWYITEFDGKDTFFGFVQGDYPEWGYVSKSELNKLIEKDFIFITSYPEKTLQECM